MTLNYIPHRLIVEEELQGVGNGWTNISRDVLARPGGVKITRGIRGGGLNDRVASPGTAQFLLDNDGRSNSARIDGYYYPENPSCRPGHAEGSRLRMRVEASPAGTPTVFIGKIEVLKAKGGKRRRKEVSAMAVDWMQEADAHKLSNLATQTNVRADQVLSTVVAAMGTQPPGGTSFDQGLHTYLFALDGARDERTTALIEFLRVAKSDLGYVFLKADGTLRFQNREARIRDTANLFTLRRTMTAVDARRSIADVMNKVDSTVYPRSIDASATKVLYNLNTKPFIPPGGTLTLLCPYTDPDIAAARVGATDLQTFIAGTDYTMHATEGGANDLTANFAVTPTFGSNRAKIAYANNGAVGGYITKQQIRGRALNLYEPVTVSVTDDASIALIGERPESLDRPYIHDPAQGKLGAEYALYLHGSSVQRGRVLSVRFIANTDESHMIAALTRDIGDRIGITESILGLTDRDSEGRTLGYYIQGIELEIFKRVMYCTWALAPADRTSYWILGQEGRSELGTTTVIGPN